MADLTITIDARTLAGVRQAFSEVQNAFKSLEQAASRSGMNTSTNLERVTSRLRDIENQARRIGIVATGALTGIATALFRAGAQAEGLQARFKALTNNIDEANQIIKQIQKSDAFMLFGAQALDAAAKLRAVGVAAQDLPRLINAIASAAAASGDQASSAFDRIATAIGQVATKGRATAEEIQQQLSEFIPAQKLIAESLGITTAKLQEMMQQGLPAGRALNALVQGIERNFGAMTEEIKKTPTGQLLLLRSTLQQILQNAGSPFARALADVFASVRASLLELARSGALREFAQTLAQTVRALVPALKQILQLLTQILQTFNALPTPIKTLALLLGPSSLIVAGLVKAVSFAIKFGQTLVGIYNWLRTGALASAVARVFGASGASAGAAGAIAAGALRTGGVIGLSLTPATAAAQTAEYTNAISGAEKALLATQPSLANDLQKLRQKAQQFVAEHPELIDAAHRGGYRAAQQRATEIVRQQAPLPNAPNFLADLDKYFEPRLPKTKAPKTSTAAADPTAARIALARDIAEMRAPNIAALIEAGNLGEARKQLAALRAELENLAKRYTQIVFKEAEQQIQRKLTASERAALAEKTRLEFLREVDALTNQIAKTEQQQHEEKIRATERERERETQALREIHQLRIQLAEARIANLPLEQQRAALEQLSALQAAPAIAELLTGDPRTAALKLAILQEQHARRIAELNERIASEQQRRAQELHAIREQTLALEQSIAKTRAQAAVELVNAELQNARDTLELLQRQGASREMLRAAQEAVLNAQAKQLDAQKQSLQLALQQLEADKQRLQAQYMFISAFDAQNILQKRQLELQVAQLEVERARIESALAQIERQLKNINIVIDENNPLTLFLTSLQYAIQQLNTILADAMLGFNKFGKSLKDWLRNLARDFFAILIRALLNPLYLALQAIAARIASVIFAAFGLSGAAGTAAGTTAGAAAGAGLAALGGIGVAAGLGYFGGQALGLNPTGSAIGAGIGFAAGGPIGALVGGLLGGLFGRRGDSKPRTQIIPLTSPTPTIIRNDIRLYLDNREISRAIASNAI